MELRKEKEEERKEEERKGEDLKEEVAVEMFPQRNRLKLGMESKLLELGNSWFVT